MKDSGKKLAVEQSLKRNSSAGRFVRKIQSRLKRCLGVDLFSNLDNAVIELNSVGELKKLYGWDREPILDDPEIRKFEDLKDLNERRLRDAEVLGTVARNVEARVCLEIGTEEGRGTAILAENAPAAEVFTVNIPPEEIAAGKGGILTTGEIKREKIGAYYRSKALKNIKQIFANTGTWEPGIGPIDVAFIDGCHDAEFVYNDTRKILKHMRPGSFLLWHDFHPGLKNQFYWIYDVCLGIERLYLEDLIEGRIFHVRDSWIGVYRVP